MGCAGYYAVASSLVTGQRYMVVILMVSRLNWLLILTMIILLSATGAMETLVRQTMIQWFL